MKNKEKDVPQRRSTINLDVEEFDKKLLEKFLYEEEHSSKKFSVAPNKQDYFKLN